MIEDTENMEEPTQYNLVRDRITRQIIPPDSYGYDGMISYALVVANNM